ncbi:MAG: DUF2520 domain-containing protein [Flavipsychrobacter sp.]|nr:DUF2520 domain-containing protein [Flavipsychrobacter sp.]
MTYSIIGTGNMAWFLVKRLKTAGHQCDGIWGRNPATMKALAAEMNVNAYKSIGKIADGEVDICFVAVPDHEIKSVVSALSFEKTVLAHTAGSMDLEVLSEHAKDCAVLWPVYSITRNNIPDHRDIPTAWEAGSAKAQRFVSTIGHSITDNLFEANLEKRQWLHLSAVVGNNFINHLVAICDQICAERDLPAEALQPIIHQTFERLKNSARARDLQTGPARRGDAEVLERQEALLEAHPEWQDVYRALSRSIEKMYDV